MSQKYTKVTLLIALPLDEVMKITAKQFYLGIDEMEPEYIIHAASLGLFDSVPQSGEGPDGYVTYAVETDVHPSEYVPEVK